MVSYSDISVEAQMGKEELYLNAKLRYAYAHLARIASWSKKTWRTLRRSSAEALDLTVTLH